MLEALMAYSVGLIFVLIFAKMLSLKAEGSFALLLLTLIPYGVGLFILSLVR